ncbi:DinB family protein [Geodermatophilus sp. URMC 61]|uniref:DinB family protein n=1 Tax=Geodermatophilus sp. URMC 61 TaxID=3423411 RepID=UPI00406CE741
METTRTTTVDWTSELVEQLDLHWRTQLRPRLDGLTDEEYRWEPVRGAWNVRPRGTGAAPIQAGRGDFTIDFAVPQPDPAPVTTIAWRIGHVVVDAAHAAWTAGVRSLDEQRLRRPCGPAEGPWADSPMATLVLHINREVLHHGAEMALLHDLYRWRD